jgi:hypothetical protein
VVVEDVISDASDLLGDDGTSDEAVLTAQLLLIEGLDLRIVLNRTQRGVTEGGFEVAVSLFGALVAGLAAGVGSTGDDAAVGEELTG